MLKLQALKNNIEDEEDCKYQEVGDLFEDIELTFEDDDESDEDALPYAKEDNDEFLISARIASLFFPFILNTKFSRNYY